MKAKFFLTAMAALAIVACNKEADTQVDPSLEGPSAMLKVNIKSNKAKSYAAGTAAGFMGLLGYLIGDALLSKIVFGYTVASGENGWDLTFIGFFLQFFWRFKLFCQDFFICWH